MFHTSIYVIVFITSLLYGSCQAAAGTTKGIKEVLIGRCWQYKSLLDHSKIDVLQMDVNCTELWDAFRDAVAFKDPCTVKLDDYKRFFEILNNPKKINNALFWSGLHDLVTDFTFVNDDYIVLEDTMTGFLLNNLKWCGSPTSKDGFNYTQCEKSCDPSKYAWEQASSEFADRASGTARVLLNATRANNKDAYADGSFFRTIEMPRLKVDRLIVLLASSIGQDVRETCDNSVSLRNIRNDATNRNIKVDCIDQPKLVLGVYCLKYPKGKECMTAQLTGDQNSSTDNTRLWKTVCLILVAVVAVLILYITISLAHRAMCGKPSNFKNSHSWSFSKKPMLQNDELDNNNEIERIV